MQVGQEFGRGCSVSVVCKKASVYQAPVWLSRWSVRARIVVCEESVCRQMKEYMWCTHCAPDAYIASIVSCLCSSGTACRTHMTRSSRRADSLRSPSCCQKAEDLVRTDVFSSLKTDVRTSDILSKKLYVVECSY
jgi:hypothetical protein